VISAVQVITVWLTTAMLLAQTVCPVLAFDCSCWPGTSSACLSGKIDRSGCCCAMSADDSSSACTHCRVPSCDDKFPRHRRSVCHCGDYAPAQPAIPGVPELPGPTSLADWIHAGTTCLTAATVLPSVPVHARVLSSELLVPHFKQLLHCVWLT